MRAQPPHEQTKVVEKQPFMLIQQANKQLCAVCVVVILSEEYGEKCVFFPMKKGTRVRECDGRRGEREREKKGEWWLNRRCFGTIWSSKRRQRNKCKWILHIILWFGTGNSNSNVNRPPPDWSHTHTQNAQKRTISLPKGFIHVFFPRTFYRSCGLKFVFFFFSLPIRGRRRWRPKKKWTCLPLRNFTRLM